MLTEEQQEILMNIIGRLPYSDMSELAEQCPSNAEKPRNLQKVKAELIALYGDVIYAEHVATEDMMIKIFVKDLYKDFRQDKLYKHLTKEDIHNAVKDHITDCRQNDKEYKFDPMIQEDMDGVMEIITDGIYDNDDEEMDENIVKFLDDYDFGSLDEFQHLTKDDVYDIFNNYNKVFVLDDKFDPENRFHVENFMEFICEFARVDDAP